jgi:RsiW-degrading membrane proteinase PrsW (M82 family)
MSEIICCICHQPVGPDAKRIGGRCYCERHYAKVTKERPGTWRAGLGLIVGQLAFVLIVELLVTLLKPTLTGWALFLTGLVLAVIPALIWLVFFYQQDRLEPEPKGYVLSVFILGALLAQGVGTPLLEDVFQVSRWLPTGAWVNILGSILVVGVVQEFLKYAAVRYSIYPLAEFDERADGVIYGTAVGLGYATMLNINYVVASGGVNLQAGVIRIVVTALAQASFSGLSGYFLGRAKFEDEPAWWLPSGVALAAVLNGLFTYVRGEITTTALSLSGGGFNPWPGLILAAAVAGVTFGALFYLIRRANKITLSGVDAAVGTAAEAGQ